MASITAESYVNRFFGFSLLIPKGWVVLPNRASNAGAQPEIGGSTALRAKISETV